MTFKDFLVTIGFVNSRIDYYSQCIVCMKKLTGRQRIFCSNKCAVEYNLNSDLYEDRVNNPKIKITRKQFLDRSRNVKKTN